jgi:hypothetical protein
VQRRNFPYITKKLADAKRSGHEKDTDYRCHGLVGAGAELWGLGLDLGAQFTVVPTDMSTAHKLAV